MNKDVKEYRREVYDLLALIGDCGGLYGGLISIFTTILAVLTYFGDMAFESYLVRSIFRSGEDD